MPDRFFIRPVLIIILMLQTVFVCSCSRNQKPSMRDYGTMYAENIPFSPFCEPVPYPGENPEFCESVFPSNRTEESSPENAHETQNLSPAKADDPPEDTAEKSAGESKAAFVLKTAPEKRKNQPHPVKPDDFSENAEDFKANAGTENKTEPADKKSGHLNEMDFYKQYSRKLGMELDGTENRKLIMAVAEWMGTPYLWGGCSKKGVDCSCLIRNIYEKVYGIALRRTSMSMCSQDIMPVAGDRLREGDIICFGAEENSISHVGLYLKDSKFVHASQSGGVRISSLERNYFKKRLIMAGRAIRPLQISIARLSIRELVVVNR